MGRPRGSRNRRKKSQKNDTVKKKESVKTVVKRRTRGRPRGSKNRTQVTKKKMSDDEEMVIITKPLKKSTRVQKSYPMKAFNEFRDKIKLAGTIHCDCDDCNEPYGKGDQWGRTVLCKKCKEDICGFCGYYANGHIGNCMYDPHMYKNKQPTKQEWKDAVERHRRHEVMKIFNKEVYNIEMYTDLEKEPDVKKVMKELDIKPLSERFDMKCLTHTFDEMKGLIMCSICMQLATDFGYCSKCDHYLCWRCMDENKLTYSSKKIQKIGNKFPYPGFKPWYKHYIYIGADIKIN